MPFEPDNQRQCDWCGWWSDDPWKVKCTNRKCLKPLRQSVNQELAEHGLIDYPLTPANPALASEQGQRQRSVVVRKEIPWTRIVDDLTKTP